MSEKNDIIRNWILKADHDLGTSIVIYQHIPKYKDTVTFHCQQAVEKYLKAYLIHLNIEFQKWHDLIYLLELISQKDKFDEVYYDKAANLQDYAVEIRYPNKFIKLKDSDIEEAIATAKKFRMLIIDKINIQIDYDDIIDRKPSN